MTTEVKASLTIRVGRKAYPIADYAEASRLFCAARDKAGTGGRDTPTPLIFEGDRQVAYVSYNGRVWAGDPRDWQPGRKPLYDNGSGLSR